MWATILDHSWSCQRIDCGLSPINSYSGEIGLNWRFWAFLPRFWRDWKRAISIWLHVGHVVYDSQACFRDLLVVVLVLSWCCLCDQTPSEMRRRRHQRLLAHPILSIPLSSLDGLLWLHMLAARLHIEVVEPYWMLWLASSCIEHGLSFTLEPTSLRDIM